jgi:hypothetical protein
VVQVVGGTACHPVMKTGFPGTAVTNENNFHQMEMPFLKKLKYAKG